MSGLDSIELPLEIGDSIISMATNKNNIVLLTKLGRAFVINEKFKVTEILPMPFKSKKQANWMFANKPEMAKRWAKETPSIKKLPKKVKRKK